MRETTNLRPPWIFEGRIYKPGVMGLSQEIEDFYLMMSHTKIEDAMRKHVFMEIQKLVKQNFPNADLQICGSFCTGLYLPTSDIDITVIQDGSEREILAVLRDAVNCSNMAQIGSVRLIETAKVPVLKFIENATELAIDITVRQLNGISGASEVIHWRQQYPVLPKLFFVVRQLLLFHNQGSVYNGGISSYAVLIMIVGFLKEQARRGNPKKGKRSAESTGKLLIDFLDFYGKQFTYLSHAVSLASPSPFVQREQVQISSSEWSPFVVVDPVDATGNVCRSSFAFLEVRTIFANAASELQRMVSQYRRFFPERGFLDRDCILHVPRFAEDRAKLYRAFNKSFILSTKNSGINSELSESHLGERARSVVSYGSGSHGKSNGTETELCRMKDALIEKLVQQTFGSSLRRSSNCTPNNLL